MKINFGVSEELYSSICIECPYVRAALPTSEEESLTDIKYFADIPESERMLYCWLTTFLPTTDQEQVTKYINKKGIPPQDCPKEVLFNMAGYEIRDN